MIFDFFSSRPHFLEFHQTWDLGVLNDFQQVLLIKFFFDLNRTKNKRVITLLHS